MIVYHRDRQIQASSKRVASICHRQKFSRKEFYLRAVESLQWWVTIEELQLQELRQNEQLM